MVQPARIAANCHTESKYENQPQCQDQDSPVRDPKHEYESRWWCTHNHPPPLRQRRQFDASDGCATSGEQRKGEQPNVGLNQPSKEEPNADDGEKDDEAHTAVAQTTVRVLIEFRESQCVVCTVTEWWVLSLLAATKSLKLIFRRFPEYRTGVTFLV